MNLNYSKTKLKAVYSRYKDEIEDIILFGSIMRGKENPNDIDVLVIFKKKINKEIESKIKETIDNLELDINSITLKEFQSEGFVAREGVYLEGKSLITNKKIGESIGFLSIAFLQYDLKHVRGSSRTRFYYALHGRRDQIGILRQIQAKKFSDSLIIVSYDNIEPLKIFFDHLKIEYRVIPALIPKQIEKILFS